VQGAKCKKLHFALVVLDFTHYTEKIGHLAHPLPILADLFNLHILNSLRLSGWLEKPDGLTTFRRVELTTPTY